MPLNTQDYSINVGSLISAYYRRQDNYYNQEFSRLINEAEDGGASYEGSKEIGQIIIRYIAKNKKNWKTEEFLNCLRSRLFMFHWYNKKVTKAQPKEATCRRLIYPELPVVDEIVKNCTRFECELLYSTPRNVDQTQDQEKVVKERIEKFSNIYYDAFKIITQQQNVNKISTSFFEQTDDGEANISNDTARRIVKNSYGHMMKLLIEVRNGSRSKFALLDELIKDCMTVLDILNYVDKFTGEDLPYIRDTCLTTNAFLKNFWKIYEALESTNYGLSNRDEGIPIKMEEDSDSNGNNSPQYPIEIAGNADDSSGIQAKFNSGTANGNFSVLNTNGFSSLLSGSRKEVDTNLQSLQTVNSAAAEETPNTHELPRSESPVVIEILDDEDDEDDTIDRSEKRKGSQMMFKPIQIKVEQNEENRSPNYQVSSNDNDSDSTIQKNSCTKGSCLRGVDNFKNPEAGSAKDSEPNELVDEVTNQIVELRNVASEAVEPSEISPGITNIENSEEATYPQQQIVTAYSSNENTAPQLTETLNEPLKEGDAEAKANVPVDSVEQNIDVDDSIGEENIQESVGETEDVEVSTNSKSDQNKVEEPAIEQTDTDEVDIQATFDSANKNVDVETIQELEISTSDFNSNGEVVEDNLGLALDGMGTDTPVEVQNHIDTENIEGIVEVEQVIEASTNSNNAIIYEDADIVMQDNNEITTGSEATTHVEIENHLGTVNLDETFEVEEGIEVSISAEVVVQDESEALVLSGTDADGETTNDAVDNHFSIQIIEVEQKLEVSTSITSHQDLHSTDLVERFENVSLNDTAIIEEDKTLFSETPTAHTVQYTEENTVESITETAEELVGPNIETQQLSLSIETQRLAETARTTPVDARKDQKPIVDNTLRFQSHANEVVLDLSKKESEPESGNLGNSKTLGHYDVAVTKGGPRKSRVWPTTLRETLPRQAKNSTKKSPHESNVPLCEVPVFEPCDISTDAAKNTLVKNNLYTEGRKEEVSDAASGDGSDSFANDLLVIENDEDTGDEGFEFVNTGVMEVAVGSDVLEQFEDFNNSQSEEILPTSTVKQLDKLTDYRIVTLLNNNGLLAESISGSKRLNEPENKTIKGSLPDGLEVIQSPERLEDFSESDNSSSQNFKTAAEKKFYDFDKMQTRSSSKHCVTKVNINRPKAEAEEKSRRSDIIAVNAVKLTEEQPVFPKESRKREKRAESVETSRSGKGEKKSPNQGITLEATIAKLKRKYNQPNEMNTSDVAEPQQTEDEHAETKEERSRSGSSPRSSSRQHHMARDKIDRKRSRSSSKSRSSDKHCSDDERKKQRRSKSKSVDNFHRFDRRRHKSSSISPSRQRREVSGDRNANKPEKVRTKSHSQNNLKEETETSQNESVTHIKGDKKVLHKRREQALLNEREPPHKKTKINEVSQENRKQAIANPVVVIDELMNATELKTESKQVLVHDKTKMNKSEETKDLKDKPSANLKNKKVAGLKENEKTPKVESVMQVDCEETVFHKIKDPKEPSEEELIKCDKLERSRKSHSEEETQIGDVPERELKETSITSEVNTDIKEEPLVEVDETVKAPKQRNKNKVREKINAVQSSKLKKLEISKLDVILQTGIENAEKVEQNKLDDVLQTDIVDVGKVDNILQKDVKAIVVPQASAIVNTLAADSISRSCDPEQKQNEETIAHVGQLEPNVDILDNPPKKIKKSKNEVIVQKKNSQLLQSDADRVKPKMKDDSSCKSVEGETYEHSFLSSSELPKAETTNINSPPFDSKVKNAERKIEKQAKNSEFSENEVSKLQENRKSPTINTLIPNKVVAEHEIGHVPSAELSTKAEGEPKQNKINIEPNSDEGSDEQVKYKLLEKEVKCKSNKQEDSIQNFDKPKKARVSESTDGKDGLASSVNIEQLDETEAVTQSIRALSAALEAAQNAQNYKSGNPTKTSNVVATSERNKLPPHVNMIFDGVSWSGSVDTENGSTPSIIIKLQSSAGGDFNPDSRMGPLMSGASCASLKVTQELQVEHPFSVNISENDNSENLIDTSSTLEGSIESGNLGSFDDFENMLYTKTGGEIKSEYGVHCFPMTYLDVPLQDENALKPTAAPGMELMEDQGDSKDRGNVGERQAPSVPEGHGDRDNIEEPQTPLVPEENVNPKVIVENNQNYYDFKKIKLPNLPSKNPDHLNNTFSDTCNLSANETNKANKSEPKGLVDLPTNHTVETMELLGSKSESRDPGQGGDSSSRSNDPYSNKENDLSRSSQRPTSSAHDSKSPDPKGLGNKNNRNVPEKEHRGNGSSHKLGRSSSEDKDSKVDSPKIKATYLRTNKNTLVRAPLKKRTQGGKQQLPRNNSERSKKEGETTSLDINSLTKGEPTNNPKDSNEDLTPLDINSLTKGEPTNNPKDSNEDLTSLDINSLTQGEPTNNPKDSNEDFEKVKALPDSPNFQKMMAERAKTTSTPKRDKNPSEPSINSVTVNGLSKGQPVAPKGPGSSSSPLDASKDKGQNLSASEVNRANAAEAKLNQKRRASHGRDKNPPESSKNSVTVNGLPKQQPATRKGAGGSSNKGQNLSASNVNRAKAAEAKLNQTRRASQESDQKSAYAKLLFDQQPVKVDAKQDPATTTVFPAHFGAVFKSKYKFGR